MSKRFKYYITVDEDTDNYIGEIADRRQLEQHAVANLLIKYAVKGYVASRPLTVEHIDAPTQLLLEENVNA
ncbi:MAG: hypothetical protein CMQ40_05090 [Gammaproteobacteria bacterium]|nr:hypothetical protein [Gammaproteobacteria bacterium]|tara:strand:- start:9297 stop:9509 length:213 start_codon:yes stop_codon:yes gene_type:complete